MFSAIAGLLSGAASIGSQVANYAINDANMQRTRYYNSPAAQMQRLWAAGINPYGVTSQIAGQNQGQYPSSNFDFGQSVSNSINTATSLEKLGLEMERMVYDNEFQRLSMPDRLRRLSFMTQSAYLDTLLKDKQITYQDYLNTIKALQSEWEQYLAGIPTEHYGQASGFTSGDGVDYVYPTVPKRDMEQYARNEAQLQWDINQSTRDYKVQYEMFKTLKTEQDYLIAVSRAVRERIAAAYESATNMPWDNKNPWIHVIHKLLNTGAKLYRSGNFSWENVWNALDLD